MSIIHVPHLFCVINKGLTVIVYKCWKIDGLIKDIENEHNKINGTPTTLEIKLYYPTFVNNNSQFSISGICTAKGYAVSNMIVRQSEIIIENGQ